MNCVLLRNTKFNCGSVVYWKHLLVGYFLIVLPLARGLYLFYSFICGCFVFCLDDTKTSE